MGNQQLKPVALIAIWRNVSELFGVVWLSAGSDDEAFPGGFDDRSRHQVKVVNAENALNLSEEPSQKSEVTSGHSNEARYHFREELLIREDDAGRRPSLFKQFLDLSRVEWTELVHEPDARVELRKAGDALLDAGHADEHHAGCTLVEDGSHLFKAVHLEAIRLVHEDQSRRIRYCSLFGLIFVCTSRSRLDRLQGGHMESSPGSIMISLRRFSSSILISSRAAVPFAPNRIEHDTHHSLPRHIDVAARFWTEC